MLGGTAGCVSVSAPGGLRPDNRVERSLFSCAVEPSERSDFEEMRKTYPRNPRKRFAFQQGEKKKRFAYPKAVISVSYLRMSLDYLLWLLADIVYLDHRLRALIKKSEAWVCCRTIPCK